MTNTTPVILATYHTEWPRVAAGHAQRLRALSPVIVSVHHIGSTAVPGLAAKPVIDLMPLVTDMDKLDQERPRLEVLGYQWHGESGIPERRFCTLSDTNGTRLVQLHFFKTDSPHVERHLALRNYLRSHPHAASEYENEKRRARHLHPNDSEAYSEEKAAWIQNLEADALNWFRKSFG